MAPQWIDLQGARTYGASDDAMEIVEKFDERMREPVRFGAPYGTPNARVTITSGRPPADAPLAGKIVRAVEMTVKVTVSLSVPDTSTSTIQNGYKLQVVEGTPDVAVFDVVVAALGVVAVGRPRGVKAGRPYLPTFGENQGATGVGVPETPGWTWDAPKQTSAPNKLLDYAMDDSGSTLPFRIAESFSTTGTFAYTWDDKTYPLNLAGTTGMTRDSFGGAYVDFPGPLTFSDRVRTWGVARELFADFTRLRVLVDDKPGWDGVGPLRVPAGEVAASPLTFTLKYPGGEAVRGETIRVETKGARVLLRPAGGANVPPRAWAEAATGADGVVRFEVSGVEKGEAVVEITVGRKNAAGELMPELGYLYDPPLFGVARVEVYGGADSELPPEEPPPDYPEIDFDPDAPPDPPVVEPGEPEEVCVTYPAVTGIPRTPPSVEFRPVLAWDAGANSIQELDGDVRTVFSLEQPCVGIAVGFVTHRDYVEDYSRIVVGVLFTQTGAGAPMMQVIEYGVSRTDAMPYPLGTPLELRRAQGVISLWSEDVRLYESPELVDGPLIVGCSMFATGDQI